MMELPVRTAAAVCPYSGKCEVERKTLEKAREGEEDRVDLYTEYCKGFHYNGCRTFQSIAANERSGE